MTTEQRLDRLERERRALKVSLLLAFLVAAVALVRPWRGGVIASEHLAVTTANGTTIGWMGAGRRGPWFGLADPHGAIRADLTVAAEGTRLLLKDANGKTRVALGDFATGPRLALYAADGATITWSTPQSR